MPDYYTKLLPGEQYHIFTRAVGRERLFVTEDNYHFFLKRYKKYITPVADSYCYCLLPNHFHLLIRIKAETALEAYYKCIKNGKQVESWQMADFVMQQFSNFLNSYTKTFNKINFRKGALFMDFLRRVPIESHEQLAATAFYIHKNPVHHGYCKTMQEWKWSSFNAMLSPKSTMLLREEVLGWYGGMKYFLEYHSQPLYLKKAIALE